MVDRVVVYPGQIPLDSDVLGTNKDVMIALGYLARACLGVGTFCDGLACTPTVPASMQVLIGQGSITTPATIDASAYGTIAADNANPLMKMGINPVGTTAFTLTAPGVSGQSINYLVEASFVEADGNPIALPYYNAANPSQPFTGPGNSQALQNTVRTQRVGLQLKAGSPASAGTQQTPAVDAGWSGLYTITVNFAQTTVTVTSIAVYPNAPFIAAKIPALAPLFSPALLGAGTSTTPPANDSSTRIATTAFVASNHLPNIQFFTTTQTFVVPSTTSRVKARIWGGGGGGGGTFTAGSVASGGGGGGYSEGTYTVTPGSSMTVTIGAGGTGGIGAANGVGGGTSSFATGVATGGSGGTGASSSQAVTAGIGGVGSGGQLNLSGNNGGLGFSISPGFLGGLGGATYGTSNSQFSVGTTAQPGQTGTFPGGAGSGALLGGTGGLGSTGFVILEF